jgi:hypothetical protein
VGRLGDVLVLRVGEVAEDLWRLWRTDAGTSPAGRAPMPPGSAAGLPSGILASQPERKGLSDIRGSAAFVKVLGDVVPSVEERNLTAGAGMRGVCPVVAPSRPLNPINPVQTSWLERLAADGAGPPGGGGPDP